MCPAARLQLALNGKDLPLLLWAQEICFLLGIKAKKYVLFKILPYFLGET